jgi:hypothetical protein
MMHAMKTANGKIHGLVAIFLAAGLTIAWGDADPARYGSIVDRNPFGLKPPPPPPDPSSQVPVAPPPPLATVELTGITSILSSKRACLEIIPGPGKQMLKPILAEGEKVESVEVVTIDMEKNQVVVRNGNIVTNLTFRVAKGPTTPTPPQAGHAGLPGAGAVAHPPIVSPQPNLNYSQPSSAGRSGVIMTGGTPTYEAPVANPAATSVGGMQPANAGAPGTFRSIPSRNIRSGLPQPPSPANTALSPEAAVIDMEEKRRINPTLPYPPTLLTPPPLPGAQ